MVGDVRSTRFKLASGAVPPTNESLPPRMVPNIFLPEMLAVPSSPRVASAVVSVLPSQPAPGSTAGTTSDAYAGNFVVPAAGSYAATARVTKDGVNWTACDLNGAGSSGLSFDMTQVSLFTVP